MIFRVYASRDLKRELIRGYLRTRLCSDRWRRVDYKRCGEMKTGEFCP